MSSGQAFPGWEHRLLPLNCLARWLPVPFRDETPSTRFPPAKTFFPDAVARFSPAKIRFISGFTNVLLASARFPPGIAGFRPLVTFVLPAQRRFNGKSVSLFPVRAFDVDVSPRFSGARYSASRSLKQFHLPPMKHLRNET